jgi:hypothetical protein
MFELQIDVIPPGGGKVEVTHIFRGETKAAARRVFKQHAAGCEFLTPAIAEDRIGEDVFELDDDEWQEYNAEHELIAGPDLDDDEEEEAEDEADPEEL